MDLKTAKELFEEIVELCYNTSNNRLIDVVDDIYNDIIESDSISEIIVFLSEIHVVINEEDIPPEEGDIIYEIQEKIESLYDLA